jgi:hypothetical protein
VATFSSSSNPHLPSKIPKPIDPVKARQYGSSAVLDGELAVPSTRNPLQRGRIPARGLRIRGLFLQSGVEGLVLRGETPRTWSGPEGSSHKWSVSGAAGKPDLSWLAKDKPDVQFNGRCTVFVYYSDAS